MSRAAWRPPSYCASELNPTARKFPSELESRDPYSPIWKDALAACIFVFPFSIPAIHFLKISPNSHWWRPNPACMWRSKSPCAWLCADISAGGPAGGEPWLEQPQAYSRVSKLSDTLQPDCGQTVSSRWYISASLENDAFLFYLRIWFSAYSCSFDGNQVEEVFFITCLIHTAGQEAQGSSGRMQTHLESSFALSRLL